MGVARAKGVKEVKEVKEQRDNGTQEARGGARSISCAEVSHIFAFIAAFDVQATNMCGHSGANSSKK